MRPQGHHPQKSCIDLGRDVAQEREYVFGLKFHAFFMAWSGYVGARGGDMEALEDFSPLSTNATYWRACQDTFEGAMPQCLRGDACGGFATGKYSQTIVGKKYFDFWFK